MTTISVLIVSADSISGTDRNSGTESEALEDPAPRQPVTVRELISGNLRRLRLDAAASHDDVARAARRYGLSWTTQWVAAVERGQRAPTAEQLIALPMVLAEAFGHRIGMADLLMGNAPVVLGKEAPDGTAPAPVSGAYLREVVTASPYRRPFSAPGTPFSTVDSGDGALARAAAKMREISRAGLGDVDIRALARAEAGAGDVEDKLARKIGVAPIIVIAAAASLWGRSLTEERQARLTADTFSDEPHPKPAVVMRRLTTDVTDRIEEAAAKANAPTPPAIQDATIELPIVAPGMPEPEPPAVLTEVPRPRVPVTFSLFSPDPA